MEKNQESGLGTRLQLGDFTGQLVLGVIVDLPPPPSSTALADDTLTGGHAHSSWQTMPPFHPSGLQSSPCKVQYGVIN